MNEKKLILCIANRCFIKCPGCYHIFPQNENEVTTEEIVSFISASIGEGVTKITFTGGDPLTRPDISELVEFCHSSGLKVNIDTVGTPFVTTCLTYDRKKKIELISDHTFLKMVDFIGIPIDGSTDEIIQLFRRGRKNFLDEQLKVLSFLEKIDATVCINTVLHRGNFNDLNNIHSIISRFNSVRKWQIFEFMPIGELGYKNKKKYEIESNKTIDIDKLSGLNPNLFIEYKTGVEREDSYMLVNSEGDAYKNDLSNTVKLYGNIKKKETWSSIFTNL